MGRKGPPNGQSREDAQAWYKHFVVEDVYIYIYIYIICRHNHARKDATYIHNSYIYIYIYDAIKKVPIVEADIFILLPFRFRSASVFLPLCGNLGWSFRVSFNECHVMLPLRFRYAGKVTIPSVF